MDKQQVIKHLIEDALNPTCIVHGDTGNEALNEFRTSVLKEMHDDGVLVQDRESGKWLVFLTADEDDNPVCPVCGGAMRGNVVKTHYDVAIWISGNGIEYDLPGKTHKSSPDDDLLPRMRTDASGRSSRVQGVKR
jgi:hypothetical protein